MTDKDNKKGNLLISYKFPDNTNIINDIDNEIIIQNEISKLLYKLKNKGLISNFVIADDELISEKLTQEKITETDKEDNFER